MVIRFRRASCSQNCRCCGCSIRTRRLVNSICRSVSCAGLHAATPAALASKVLGWCTRTASAHTRSRSTDGPRPLSALADALAEGACAATRDAAIVSANKHANTHDAAATLRRVRVSRPIDAVIRWPVDPVKAPGQVCACWLFQAEPLARGEQRDRFPDAALARLGAPRQVNPADELT